MVQSVPGGGRRNTAGHAILRGKKAKICVYYDANHARDTENKKIGNR